MVKKEERATGQAADFGFGEEQEMVRDSARRYFDDMQPLLQLRKDTAGTEDPYLGDERIGRYDQKAWQDMVELGWTMLAVPEAAGGAGLSLITAVTLTEEIGRAALPTPLTSTLLATYVLAAADSKEANEWLAKIVAGSSAALAIFAADGGLEADSTEVQFADGRLSGTSYFIQDLQKVDFLVVAARNSVGIGLYCVDVGGEGISLAHDRIVDLTRDQGRATFTSTPAQCVADGDAGVDALNASRPALLTLVSADIIGGCEWLLQTTAEYAKIRTQFDRPIGFFQAVKHPVVNMMIAVDEARSLVYSAACAFDMDPADAARTAYLAKSSASDTAEFCANRGTQLHGGIGFTWEADVQIYHKRAIHSQHLFGDGVWQREKLAQLL